MRRESCLLYLAAQDRAWLLLLNGHVLKVNDVGLVERLGVDMRAISFQYVFRLGEVS